MTFPQINYIKCKRGFRYYKMSYLAWGNQENCSKTLLCVHGLNRNCRDFDYVGKFFAANGYYVVAPDIVGRGNSDYLVNPSGYDIPFYINDVLGLIKALDLKNIDYIGTSMGGIIGMSIAALPYSPIRKLILNDVGASIDAAGLERIARYSVKEPVFDSYSELKNYLMEISADFGNLPDEVWEFFIRTSSQKNDNGKYILKRDARLSRPFNKSFQKFGNIDLWHIWNNVKLPTLVLHGEKSDILNVKTIEKMMETNSLLSHFVVANAGHAPYLYSEDLFHLILGFLGNNL